MMAEWAWPKAVNGCVPVPRRKNVARASNSEHDRHDERDACANQYPAHFDTTSSDGCYTFKKKMKKKNMYTLKMKRRNVAKKEAWVEGWEVGRRCGEPSTHL